MFDDIHLLTKFLFVPLRNWFSIAFSAKKVKSDFDEPVTYFGDLVYIYFKVKYSILFIYS